MDKKTDTKTKKRNFVSLQEYCIENHMEYLLEEWDRKKNGSLTPENVTAGSSKKVLWILSYDDEKTGKHFNFEWKSQIFSRAKGTRCPFLTGHKVWKGFNDLATTHPELAAEWDYEKNKLLPFEVTAGSGKKVWWKCKVCGHRWKAAVAFRRISGCPECAKELRTSFPEQAAAFYLEKHFPDTESGNWKVLDGKELDVYIPSVPAAVEYDGKRYHKNVKRDLEKSRLCTEKGILLIRIREEGCPAMEETPFLKVISCIPGNEEGLADAIRQAGEILGISSMDVDIGRDRQEIYSRYIKRRKENSLAVTHPDLAAQWDYGKNGSLMPENVTAGSGKKVWWLQPYDDSKTGKHFDFSWQAEIKSRTREKECPYLTGKKVWKGFNDLVTTHPELAAEWDYEKNGDLKPEDVTAGSGRKVWWILSYDDKKTGRHFDFSWEASIKDRAGGHKCPYLTGNKVWKGFNDLETYCKENERLDILSWWDYEKNGDLKPSDVTAGSGKKVWWIKNGIGCLKQVRLTVNHS